ncbi:unnamed protein product [Echinostoma caproni]|uniref:Tubulin polyglutamylase TTLL4 n=1 Tax=Echinostoma caproni TaxID=27848 RepID=A0A183ARZ6_9TREM|nr:unnamed protein product [Echinostoma caproni]
MLANATPSKAHIAQKQFAKELTARLVKLALERCTGDKPKDANDLQHTVNSLPTEIEMQTEFRRSTQKTQEQQASGDKTLKSRREFLTEKPVNLPSSVLSDELKHQGIRKHHIGTTNEPGQLSKEQEHVLANLKNNTKLRSISSASTSPVVKPEERYILEYDECNYTPIEIANASSRNRNTWGVIYGDELDCLEDDKVQIEDTESGADASDSEVSCSDGIGKLYPVIPSLFPNTPSVIRFVGDDQTVVKLPKPYRSRLKWRPSAITPNVVKRALKRSHFRLTLKSPDWLGYYGNHLKPMAFRPIREFQKVNHFPGSFQLGRKDKLWNNLSRLRAQFGRKMVDFVPRTFYLPCDFRLLKEVWSRNDTPACDCSTNLIGNTTRPKWIMKPPAAARGIGVKVLRQWSDVPKQRNVIVQSYISRPYLIHDTKFDLRLYVYVTGFNPFRAYLHRQGLVRFASQKQVLFLRRLRRILKFHAPLNSLYNVYLNY